MRVRTSFRACVWIALAGLLVSGCGEEPVKPAVPTLVGLTPAQALAGQLVALSGSDLGTKGAVLAGERSLPTKNWSPTQVTFLIPADLPPGKQAIHLQIDAVKLGPLELTVLPPPMTLASLEPETSKVGDVVTLKGTALGDGKDGAVLYYMGAKVEKIERWTPEAIEFVAPVPGEGSAVWIEKGKERSNELYARLKRPTATAISPNPTLPGKVIEITGSDFGTTPGKVSQQKGGDLKIVSWADTRIEAEVPMDTGSEILLRVSNANGTSHAVRASALMYAPAGPVGSEATPGKFVTLALDAQDFPHMLAFDPEKSTFSELGWNGQGWTKSKVEMIPPKPPASFVDQSATIQKQITELLKNEGVQPGKPLDAKALQAKLDKLNAELVKPTRTTEITPSAGFFPTLVIDKTGRFHATMHEMYAQRTIYMTRTADSAWTFRPVTGESMKDGFFSSIALAADGAPQVSFMQLTPNQVSHAVLKGESFVLEPADTTPNNGVSITSAIDAKGDLHMAFLDYGKQDLRYVTKAGGAYKGEVVDAEGWTGDTPALALDAKGEPWIAYTQRDEQGLIPAAVKLAHREGGAWKVEDVDRAPGIGGQPALFFDSKGRMQLVYLDATGAAIVHAIREKDGWKKKATPVKGLRTSLADVGAFAVALGSDDVPRVATWAGEPSNLEYLLLKQ